MRPSIFTKKTRLPYSVERVWNWHTLPGAFERLTPPWERVVVLRKYEKLKNGAEIELRVGPWPFCFRWLLTHRDVKPLQGFTDVQVSGPFKRWEHTHTFTAESDLSCYLEDRVVYEVPLGLFGRLLLRPIVERKLNRLFGYRHIVTENAIHSENVQAGSETQAGRDDAS